MGTCYLRDRSHDSKMEFLTLPGLQYQEASGGCSYCCKEKEPSCFSTFSLVVLGTKPRASRVLVSVSITSARINPAAVFRILELDTAFWALNLSLTGEAQEEAQSRRDAREM